MARQSLKNEELEQTKTVLDGDASIYQKRENNTKETWNQLEGKSKAQFFADYYLLKIVVVVAVIAVVVYLSYLFLRPTTPTCFYAAFLYADIDNEAAETITEDFAQKLGVDPKEYQVTISDDYYLDDRSGLAASEKLLAYSYANQIDIVVADEEQFEKLASSGNMMDLSGLLDEELTQIYRNSMYRCAFNEVYLDGEEDSTEYPFGIYLDETNAVYKKLDCSGLERPVMGIFASTKNPQNAIRFLRYLNGKEVTPMTEEELAVFDGKDRTEQEKTKEE